MKRLALNLPSADFKVLSAFTQILIRNPQLIQPKFFDDTPFVTIQVADYG